MRELGGKVAVVTGAASGIGRGMAEAFLDEGMHVVLADVEAGALEKTADELSGRGKVLAVVTDVSDAESVDRLARTAVDTFGPVSVLCNNAGVGGGGPSWEATLDTWRWVLGVNLWGVIHGVRSFVPAMVERAEPAHIVNTASVQGLISPPFAAPYNVSKHSVVTLSETLAHELATIGSPVKVSVLCPAAVNTGIVNSERNRPDALGGSAPPTIPDALRPMVEAMRAFIAAGMDPAEVGRIVRDAIHDERFLILTHPDWEARITDRAADLAAGSVPQLRFGG